MMDDDPDGARRPTMTQTRSDASGSTPQTIGQRFRKVLRPLPEPINPALLKHERERALARQNRVADAITAFSGSMLFVYVHIIWFSCWIGFGVESYPYGLLTMIVSLEAIFLSTFVLISQNRADAKRQVIADEQWRTVKEEDRQNVELLKISNQILALTQEVRAMASAFRDQDEIAALAKEVRALRSSRGEPSK
jgi:uncharacterized membrane protein